MNKLELLSNELLLYLFEYFDDVDLIRAFDGLKLRFNNLLSSYLRNCHFDFRSIYKTEFEFICQQYLPLITDRIISLHLSENDDTPQQLDLFHSFIPSFNQFIRLQSLSLTNVRYAHSVNRIINQLPCLTQLTISACFSNYDSINIITLIDSIWRLPKLIHCTLENVEYYEALLTVPTVISFSLQYLTINNGSYNLAEFTRLVEYTPNLRCLGISIWDIYSAEQSSIDLQSLSRLKLSFQGSSQVMTNILKMMPNLCYLKIKLHQTIFNGFQWEQIIEEHLPNLKTFRFMLQFSFPDPFNQETKINQLILTFQTPFWLYRHRWFVQYHWNPLDEKRLISLYTLPYSFDYFVLSSNMIFKSTSLDKVYDDHSYKYVRSLMYDSCTSKEISVFSNIRSLHINLPFNDYFRSIVPNLNRLISLDIERFNDNKARFQLQALLDQAPNLYSLKFRSSYFCHKFLFQLKSTSIRQLDLYDCNHWFTKSECQALINSSFSEQCENLFIKIKKRSDILQIITKMNQLRALIFQCGDDRWETEENQLIEWLDHRLPSTCAISRDTNKSDIRIWIR